MNFRSIRFKTIFVMFITLAIFFLVVSLFISKIIEEQFQKIENQKVEENVARVVDAYKSIIENINIKLSDWATWDDTYQFITDKNKVYIKSNLTAISTENLKLHYMIFANNNGEIVANNGDEIPDDLKALIANGGLLITGDNFKGSKKGILNLKSGLLMFASRPIVTSEGKGPIRGSLLFAAYLDKGEVDNLSQIVHLPIEIVADIGNGQATPTKDVIYGYAKIDDFLGNPAFRFKIDYVRDITKQGVKTVNYFLSIFLVSGVFFLVILFVYLDRILMYRIFRLSTEVDKIGQNGKSGLSSTLYNGTDEISSLSRNINKTFNRLQDEENRFTIFMNNLPNVAWIKDSEGWKYTYVNQAWEAFFKKTLKETAGKTDADIWSEAVVTDLRKHDEEVLKNKAALQTYEEVPHPDGTMHHWLVYKFPLTLGERQLVAGLATDITKLKKTEEELTKKTIELERTNSLMVGRELKMAALKEEITKLQGLIQK